MEERVEDEPWSGVVQVVVAGGGGCKVRAIRGNRQETMGPRSAAKSGIWSKGIVVSTTGKSVCSVQQTEKSSCEYSVLCPDTQPWTEANRLG